MESSIETQPDSVSADATRAAFFENDCIPRLLKLGNGDGGWSFREGGASRVEPTAWAVQALRSVAGTNSVAAGAVADAGKFLEDAQLPDGSWASAEGATRGTWVTSLGCWALSADSGQAVRVEKGLKWLMAERPGESSLWWKIRRRLSGTKSATNQDDSVYGWSWTPGTASWVEPTAYACLALRSNKKILAVAGERLQVAEKMLFDLMCVGGGWNAGNPATYGAVGSPEFGPTVWALLALRGNAERPEIQESLAWVEKNWARVNTPSALALAAICLRAYGRGAGAILDALQKLWANEEIMWTVPAVAWTALSMSGDQGWLPAVNAGEAR